MPTSTQPVVHVRPEPDGHWSVAVEGGRDDLAKHPEATAATRAAAALARRIGGGRVVVHDCYDHLHTSAVEPSSPRDHVKG